MKFLNFGLVAISSLFAAASAAPAAPGHLHAPAVPELPKNVDVDVIDTRGEQNPIATKIQTTIVEVKKHTSKINETSEGTAGSYGADKKEDIVKLVKSEVTIIIGLVHTLVADVVELLTGTVEIVEKEKTEIVGLVLELIFEILFTLKKVIAVLGISIFELLGPLVFALLSVIVHLLCVLNVVIDGLLKLVFTLLGSVVGLLLEVLKGLLPIVLGLVGGVLSKLDLGSLLCSIL